MFVRLQKYLAECGVASRRKAEELIAAGQVEVNGEAARLGQKIDPSLDVVTLNGERVLTTYRPIYLKLNKPFGYVCSTRGQGSRTIFELIKDVPGRLFPIGRLDKDSEGLMLLTNDGELANKLMHPRYEHEKEYIVNAELRIMNDELRKLSSGIIIDEKKTLPAKVKKLGEKQFSIVLREGRKRQIRRMVEAVGNKVVRLMRTRIGNVKLGNLPPGKYDIISKPWP